MVEFLITMFCCFIAALSFFKLAFVLDSLGGYSTAQKRHRERLEQLQIQRDAQQEIVARAIRDQMKHLPPQMWHVSGAMIEPIEPIAPIERRLERWSDITPSQSGPFTVEVYDD